MAVWVPIFWVSLAIVGYVYVGYPLGIMLMARVRSRRVAANASALPSISIVIAARNEAERLPARIQNLLALDYPTDRRQIIVVSDGSTDGTMEMLARYGSTVEALAVPARGKALALNAGVSLARHDVIVFADARQTFAPEALRALVAPLADPTIGGVTGELVLDAETAMFANRRTAGDRRASIVTAAHDVERRGGSDRRRSLVSTVADGVGLYWRYEKQLRRAESAVHSTLGATGAIYAIRRALWQPLPADTILDDVLTPMRIVLAGRRVVFTEHARASDRAAADAGAESRRKVRTLAGNFQILALEPRMLLPWRNPVWLQYVSHKVGRLIVPYALVLSLVSSAALANAGVIYLAAFVSQMAFYLLAAYGAWLEHAGSSAAARLKASRSTVARDGVERDGFSRAATAPERDGFSRAATALERDGFSRATTALERDGFSRAATALERDGFSRAATALERDGFSRAPREVA